MITDVILLFGTVILGGFALILPSGDPFSIDKYVESLNFFIERVGILAPIFPFEALSQSLGLFWFFFITMLGIKVFLWIVSFIPGFSNAGGPK